MIKYQYFPSYSRSEACHLNAVTPGLLFRKYLWQHKVLLSNRETILSYQILRITTSRHKCMVLSGKNKI